MELRFWTVTTYMCVCVGFTLPVQTVGWSPCRQRWLCWRGLWPWCAGLLCSPPQSPPFSHRPETNNRTQRRSINRFYGYPNCTQRMTTGHNVHCSIYFSSFLWSNVKGENHPFSILNYVFDTPLCGNNEKVIRNTINSTKSHITRFTLQITPWWHLRHLIKKYSSYSVRAFLNVDCLCRAVHRISVCLSVS